MECSVANHMVLSQNEAEEVVIRHGMSYLEKEQRATSTGGGGVVSCV